MSSTQRKAELTGVQHRPGRHEFTGIQALRAFAALMIVVAHGKPGQGLGNWDDALQGVNVFFVISGFVMIVASAGRPTGFHEAARFIERRLVRIAPLYWLVTTIRVLQAYHRNWGALREYWLFLLSSYLFLFSKAGSTTVLGERFYMPVLSVGWTLNFEMAFYCCFAVMLWLRRSPLWLIPPFIGLVILGRFSEPGWPAEAFLLNPRLLLFLAGMVVGKMVLLGRLFPRSIAWGVLASWLGMLVFLGNVNASWHTIVLSSLSALLVASVVSLEPVFVGRIPSWLLLLGDASYSLYLIHILFQQPFVKRTSAFLTGFSGTEQTAMRWIFFVADLILCCLIGVLVHLKIEKPLLARVSHWLGFSKPVLAPAKS